MPTDVCDVFLILKCVKLCPRVLPHMHVCWECLDKVNWILGTFVFGLVFYPWLLLIKPLDHLASVTTNMARKHIDP